MLLLKYHRPSGAILAIWGAQSRALLDAQQAYLQPVDADIGLLVLDLPTAPPAMSQRWHIVDGIAVRKAEEVGCCS